MPTADNFAFHGNEERTFGDRDDEAERASHTSEYTPYQTFIYEDNSSFIVLSLVYDALFLCMTVAMGHVERRWVTRVQM